MTMKTSDSPKEEMTVAKHPTNPPLPTLGCSGGGFVYSMPRRGREVYT